jgi:hypothetical protein
MAIAAAAIANVSLIDFIWISGFCWLLVGWFIHPQEAGYGFCDLVGERLPWGSANDTAGSKCIHG